MLELTKVEYNGTAKQLLVHATSTKRPARVRAFWLQENGDLGPELGAIPREGSSNEYEQRFDNQQGVTDRMSVVVVDSEHIEVDVERVRTVP